MLQALCLHSYLTVNPMVHRLCWLCVSLSPSPRSVGRFYLVSPQSLELDTGVSHYSLDLLITAHLRTCSPDAAFCLPTPPSPHTPTARLRPGSPPPFLERKSATAICAPGLWTTLNLKGCKARYQRVIRMLVSFKWWRGAWSEQRKNSHPRR